MNNISDAKLIELFKNNLSTIKQMEFVKKSLDIVFIFGASSNLSMRSKFINFAKSQITNLSYITIEELTNDLKLFTLKKGIERKKIHLIRLEHQAMMDAYSILIFPESPGSFAELGYFSNDEKLRKKIISIKNSHFLNEKSYVNYLIDYIHYKREVDAYCMPFTTSKKRSFFEFFLKKNNSLILNQEFSQILSTIEDTYKAESSSDDEIYLSIKNNIKEIPTLFFLYEIIRLFPALKYSELRIIYKEMLSYFKLPFKEDRYQINLSILVIANSIKRERINDIDFFSIRSESEFVKYKCSKMELNEVIELNNASIFSLRHSSIPRIAG